MWFQQDGSTPHFAIEIIYLLIENCIHGVVRLDDCNIKLFFSLANSWSYMNPESFKKYPNKLVYQNTKTVLKPTSRQPATNNSGRAIYFWYSTGFSQKDDKVRQLESEIYNTTFRDHWYIFCINKYYKTNLLKEPLVWQRAFHGRWKQSTYIIIYLLDSISFVRQLQLKKYFEKSSSESNTKL